MTTGYVVAVVAALGVQVVTPLQKEKLSSSANAEERAASAPVRQAADVYAFCTVRDITLGDDEVYRGRVYRSEIFLAPKSYDAEISLRPMIGGVVSRAFEKQIGSETGFRPDRTGDPDESQHYCVEAPLTPAGATEIVNLRNNWDNSSFPEVELVLSPWRPTGMGETTDELQQAKVQWRLRQNDANFAAIRAAADADAPAIRAEEDARAAAHQAEMEQYEREKAAIEATNEAIRQKAAADEADYQRRLAEWYRLNGKKGKKPVLVPKP